MSHLDAKHPATKSELRQFGLLVGGAFALLGVIAWWRHRPAIVFATAAVIGGALLLTGLVAPALLARVYGVWMRLAVLLSRVTTPIFMGVVYFVVLTPVGVVMRAIRKNPRGASERGSAWVTRPLDARRSTLERQF